MGLSSGVYVLDYETHGQCLIFAGLKRCGKSCRLRWLNYLKPDIKRGNISHAEEDLIIRLHRLLGNRSFFHCHFFILFHFHSINLTNVYLWHCFMVFVDGP